MNPAVYFWKSRVLWASDLKSQMLGQMISDFFLNCNLYIYIFKIP